MERGSISSIHPETHMIAFTPRQYFSHIERNRGCPPISQILIDTFPLVTFRILKPTVGIMSSENCPDYKILKKLLAKKKVEC